MELGASPLTQTSSQALPPAPVLPGLASVQSLTFHSSPAVTCWVPEGGLEEPCLLPALAQPGQAVHGDQGSCY